ncbi:hypothetical protein SEVIR_5G149100v4 [Setaria viridis]|uniref:GDSL esterase/lipase n=1 Tax=Setaria viridis TaxID=4556 RepID=A0A4U6UE39_SETVI|nr:GDSL esterase/lipase At1g31550-like [Setaria viridis]TKW14158.1 hypothetical protein SEVIR_5G149100v2 [Setaria viridis]
MRLVALLFQVLLLPWSFSSSIRTNYTSIFSFGDSFADTGNFVIIGGPTTPDLLIAKPPYGMTFFGYPTGRISDGRLAIDFIAEALGLPLLPPSMAANQSFRQGANFAVAGATALDREFFVRDGDTSVTRYNISLGDQLGWFDAMKPSLCSSPQACQRHFARALFVVGEFGWNDYAFMLMAGKSVDEARSHVPQVVRTICTAVEKLIGAGGKTVVVPGVTPLGCASGNLVLFATTNAADYEPDTGCLRGLNRLSREHNRQLRQALARLRGRRPGARIVYADFYAPIADFAAAPVRYGFDGTDGALRACCGGGGGRYNVNLSMACGMPGVSACADPSAYVNWDGIHLTEAANHRIADGWLRGPYAHPPILDVNT